MHFGNGMITRCRDVPSAEAAWCSDLNTTRFLRRMIRAEDPDLVVFTGTLKIGFLAEIISTQMMGAWVVL